MKKREGHSSAVVVLAFFACRLARRRSKEKLRNGWRDVKVERSFHRRMKLADDQNVARMLARSDPNIEYLLRRNGEVDLIQRHKTRRQTRVLNTPAVAPVLYAIDNNHCLL